MTDSLSDLPALVGTAVIGGGMAGLVVAAELARAGEPVVLLERRAQLGGMLASAVVDGVRVDVGAEAFATRNDAVQTLIDDFALPLERCQPNPAGARLITLEHGALVRHALPRRTSIGLPARPWAADVRAVIGSWGSLRASLEPLVRRRADESTLSLDALARRRFGARVAARLVEPICRGVYSASARDLRLASLLPELWQRYQNGSSLRAAVEATAHSQQAGSAVASLRGGMWQLPEALAERARLDGALLCTHADVLRVHAAEGGQFSIDVRSMDGSERQLHAIRVVLASGPALAAAVAGRLEPTAQHAVEATPAETVALCTVSVEHPGLDNWPLGTGALIAPDAISNAKALTHSSAKWEWIREQLPAGRHILRLSSADTEPNWMWNNASVASELARLTGVAIQPRHIRNVQVTHWSQPSPSAGARERSDRDGQYARLASHGVFLTGAWASGTGLASLIPHARRTAVAVLESAGVTPRTERTAS